MKLILLTIGCLVARKIRKQTHRVHMLEVIARNVPVIPVDTD